MPSAKDEVARRTTTRRDPRAEPESLPPQRALRSADGPPSEPVPSSARRDEVSEAVKRDPRADPESLPAMSAVRPRSSPDAAPEAPLDADPSFEADAPPTQSSPSPVLASSAVDPRLADLEPLFARTAWRDIADKLGPPEQADSLPPPLALIYALSRREIAGEAGAVGANDLAIRSMASILGVDPGSATALVLAKRLLRQNPAGWRSRPAPPARLSAAIILLGIALGVAAGSFLSLSTFQSLRFHLF